MNKIRKSRQYWNKDQEKIVLDNYANTVPEEMRRLLNGVFSISQISKKARHLGVNKSDDYKEKCGLNKSGRFLPGVQVWNKGMSFNALGRSIETRFKPGLIPPNHRPVGAIRVKVDGYVEIKIEEGRHKWRLLHHEIWKKHHGSYPPKGTALIFKDGNQQNCDISNLELFTRKQLMQCNSVHNYPESIKQVIILKGVITRKINGN